MAVATPSLEHLNVGGGEGDGGRHGLAGHWRGREGDAAAREESSERLLIA